jgi:uncharacterized membrane protein HdeD (DUF308 family)
MIAKTAAMLIVLLSAAVTTAFGVWFAVKMHQGWQAAREEPESGEPGWMILGALGLVACVITLLGLAYNLASA